MRDSASAVAFDDDDDNLDDSLSPYFSSSKKPCLTPPLPLAAASRRLPFLSSARLTAAEIARAAPEASASAPDSAESFDALPLGVWSSSDSSSGSGGSSGGGGGGRGQGDGQGQPSSSSSSSSWRLALRAAAASPRGPAWQAVAFERVVLPEGAKLFVYPCAEEGGGEEEEEQEEEEGEVESPPLLRRRRRRECRRPPSCDPHSSPPPAPSPPSLRCFSVSSEDLRLRVGGPLVTSAVPGGTAVVEVVLPPEGGDERGRGGGGGGKRAPASSSSASAPSSRQRLELRVAAVLQSHEDDDDDDAVAPSPAAAAGGERLGIAGGERKSGRRRRRRRGLSSAAATTPLQEGGAAAAAAPPPSPPSASASPSHSSPSSSLPSEAVSRTTYDLLKLLSPAGRRSCDGDEEGEGGTRRRQSPPSTPQMPPLASCFPSLLANASRGAVAIFAPLSRDLRSLATCSGALVAAAGRRGRPLVLTADHCLRGGGAPSSSSSSPSSSSSSPPSPLSTLDLWTFAFGYGVAVEGSKSENGGGLFLPCGSARLPPPSQVVQGAALRWFSRGPDVALLELPGGVPAAFGAYALGFDAVVSPPRVEVFSEEEGEEEEEERAGSSGGNGDGGGGGRRRETLSLPSSSLVALHFPGGGPARASFVREITSQFRGPEGGSWGARTSPSPSPSPPAPPTAATHWRARYFGAGGFGGGSGTSRGSSGAPLIDLSTGRVVAVLTGGSLDGGGGDGRGGKGKSGSSGCGAIGGGGGGGGKEEESFDFFGTLAAAWTAGASSVLSPSSSGGGGGGSASASPPPSSSSSSSSSSLGGAPGFDPGALSSADRGPRLGFSPSALLIPASSSAATLEAFLSRSLGGGGGGGGRALRVSLSVAPIPSGDEALRTESPASVAGAGAAVALSPSRGFVLTDAAPSISVEVRDAAPGRALPVDGRRFYVVASAREVSSLPPSSGATGAAGAAGAANVRGPARDELGMKVVVSASPRAAFRDLLARERRGRLGSAPPFDLRSSGEELGAAGLAAFWWKGERAGEREEGTDVPGGAAGGGTKGEGTSAAPPPPLPSWDVSVCLLPSLLPDAAVALYADGSLEALASGTDHSWRDRRRKEQQQRGSGGNGGGGGVSAAAGSNNDTGSSGPSPSSACIDVARGISFPAGARIDLVVSDSDFLNQALAAGAVTRLTVVRAASASAAAAPAPAAAAAAAVPSA